VLIAQAAEQHVEFVLIFPGKNSEGTREAVLKNYCERRWALPCGVFGPVEC
jgi:hypothetical protein